MADVSALEIARRLEMLPPTPQQQAVIEAPLGPALVVAGAGSGKTETMAGRVLWLLANGRVQASEILGLTFTRKAASELGERMTKRLKALAAKGLAPTYDPFDPPVVSTYNAFANGLYRDHAVRIGRDADGVVLGEAAAWQLARRVVVTADDPALGDLEVGVDTITQLVLDLANGVGEHAADTAAVAAFAEEYARTVAVLPRAGAAYQQQLDDVLAPSRTLPVLLRLVDRYREAKRQTGAVQYSDQVSLALDILDAAPDVITTLRQRHRVVLLDEYQDTSVVQSRLLARLFAGGTVMAVGDPHQSIYGWRGASAANLEGFARDFGGGRDVAVHALSTSWRNGTRILAAANAIAAPLTAASRVPVETLLPSPSASGHEVDLVFEETLPQEAAAVARWFGQRLAEGEGPTSAALLLRARRTLPQFLAAFRDADVPYHVLGVGGLLLEPEVADLVAALSVVHDPQAGPELVRLLAGGRWRVGPADLAALQRLARWLEQRDPAMQRLPQPVAEALDRSLAEGESASVVDALDLLHRRAATGFVASMGFSEEGLRRLAEAGATFAGLRLRATGDLPAFVHLVIETLGLDVEVAANERRGDPGALHAFDEALAGYLGAAQAVSLGGFLGWLHAAEQKEDLSPRSEPPEPGTVQVLTVHGSKGLEWDVVAVPRMVRDELPSKPKSTKGWLTNGVLPWPFRGDVAELPDLPWRGWADRTELKQGLDEYKAGVAAMLLAEERRLAYVAVTRAKHRLLLSGSFWATQKSSRTPSPFLADLAAAGVVAAPPDEPESPEAPEGAPAETFLWPTDPLGSRRQPVEAAARAVREATGDGGGWAEVVEALLAERARRAHGAPVRVPDRIPASRFKDYVDDLEQVVDRVRRPMPERPYKATRLGTVFHSWVEQRSGVPASAELLDTGPADGDQEVDQDGEVVGLAALQRTFEASEWGGLEPLEVETEIQVPFEGRILICKLDAVYRRNGRIEIVDWKTGAPPSGRADAELKQLQLALYRFAYAEREGLDVASIDAAFYFVAHDRVVRPERVWTPDELRAAWRASGVPAPA